MTFYTQHLRPPKVLETGGGEVLVDRAGYKPINKRIEELINAGIRLRESVREEYDGTEEEVMTMDVPVDREPGVDLADATRIRQELSAKYAKPGVKPVQDQPGRPGTAPTGENKPAEPSPTAPPPPQG